MIEYFIILSGGYVSPEIRAEFGLLPPVMLPLAGNRLYEHQINFAKSFKPKQLVLSLPADYSLPKIDEKRLNELNVRIVRVPTNLTLVQSLSFVLEVLDSKNKIALLHGDTFIDADIELLTDAIFFDKNNDDYEWDTLLNKKIYSSKEVDNVSDKPQDALCGFFVFSDSVFFRNCCSVAADFVHALNSYIAKKNTSFVLPRQWLDLGHLSLYFTARRDFLVTRAFNSITYNNNRLTKSSANSKKIKMEVQWYKNVPPELKHYVPQIFDSREYLANGNLYYQYDLEYLYLPNIAEVIIFGNISVRKLKFIVNLCVKFLEECERFTPLLMKGSKEFCQNHFDFLIRKKSIERIKKFQEQTEFDIDREIIINGYVIPSINEILSILINKITPTRESDVCFWHGDLFFGNILYDARARSIRLIDPRGEGLPSEFSIYGDKRYDRAKLLHSLIGFYDEIIASRCDFKINSANDFSLNFNVNNVFANEIAKNTLINGEPLLNRENLAITIILFISMLPLHNEDKKRQMCLLANAARLFLSFKNEEF